jgi:hypothetical protein
MDSRRPRVPVSADEMAQVRAMTHAGRTCPEIAAALCRPLRTIRDIRYRKGWHIGAAYWQRNRKPDRARKESLMAAVSLAEFNAAMQASADLTARTGTDDAPPPVAVVGPNPQPGVVPDPALRDLWCRRANRCLDVAQAGKWAALVCSFCPVRGTDQEDTAERMRGLALMQAEGPEVYTPKRPGRVAGKGEGE